MKGAVQQRGSMITGELLLGLSEANCIPAEIVDGIVLAEEDIAYDPELEAVGHVKPGERGHASSLNLKDVVGTLEHVGFLVEVKGKVREVGNRTAFNSVLAVPTARGTDLSVDHLRHVGGESDEGSACIAVSIMNYVTKYVNTDQCRWQRQCSQTRAHHHQA